MTNETPGKLVLALVLTSMALAWGCSPPKVRHTSISGDLAYIEHWRLDWAGTEDSPAIDIPGLYEKSKYTAAEYCTRYVEDIRRELTRTYDFSFAENYLEVGRIEVELSGDKLSAYVPPFDTANPYQDIAPADRPAGSYPESDLLGATASLFTDRDQVRKVRLSFYDLDDDLSGTVFIGDSHEDKVEPKFVARVIDEIIRTGRYKGSPIIPVSASVEGR